MKKNNLVYLFMIGTALVIFIACGKNTKKKLDVKNNIQINNSDILYYNFQDTIKYNEYAYGSIKYNLKLKEISHEEIAKRYTFLYIITSSNDSLMLKDINEKNIKHQSFIDTIGDGTINFKAKFHKLGKNLLNAIIEDKIILKKRDSLGNTVILAKEIDLYKNVFVKKIKN